MKNLRFSRTVVLLVMMLTIVLSATGGTIAWFTDNVASSNNLIKSGNLDIEASFKTHGNTEWTDLKDADNLFKDVL